MRNSCLVFDGDFATGSQFELRGPIGYEWYCRSYYENRYLYGAVVSGEW